MGGGRTGVIRTLPCVCVSVNRCGIVPATRDRPQVAWMVASSPWPRLATLTASHCRATPASRRRRQDRQSLASMHQCPCCQSRTRCTADMVAITLRHSVRLVLSAAPTTPLPGRVVGSLRCVYDAVQRVPLATGTWIHTRTSTRTRTRRHTRYATSHPHPPTYTITSRRRRACDCDPLSQSCVVEMNGNAVGCFICAWS